MWGDQERESLGSALVGRDLGQGGPEIEMMIEGPTCLPTRDKLALGHIIDTGDGHLHVRGHLLRLSRTIEVITTGTEIDDAVAGPVAGPGLAHGHPYRVRTRTITNHLRCTYTPR